MTENIRIFAIYNKLYIYSALLFFLPAAAGAYRDGMGYLEIRLAAGTPPLPLRIDGKNRGILSANYRRFYLKTGPHRIHIGPDGGRNRYRLDITLHVAEDLTRRHTLTPKRIMPKRAAATGTTTPGRKRPPAGRPIAPGQREIRFIRYSSRPGSRVYLVFDGEPLGRLRFGNSLRAVRKTGRKYYLRIVVFRGIYKLEKTELITLDRAVGPRQVYIRY